jgi:hypothetical protein
MRRWLALVLGALAALWVLWSTATAEGESLRLGGAYWGLFNDALVSYVRTHPDTPAHSGFRTNNSPPLPCDPLAALYRTGSPCAGVSVEVSRIPAWLAPIVPVRAMVRIPPRIWADPAARPLLLQLARDKAAACASVDSGEPLDIRPQRYSLGCDERQPAPHQIWFNITSTPIRACVFRGLRMDCHRLKVDESRAFRVR